MEYGGPYTVTLKSNDDGWHLIQKAQSDIETVVQSVKTVISSDVSASDNIHPQAKYELSKRIFLALVNI